MEVALAVTYMESEITISKPNCTSIIGSKGDDVLTLYKQCINMLSSSTV